MPMYTNRFANEELSVAQFICDHTPMDDYQRILSQKDYGIENADSDNIFPYDSRAKLNKSTAYIAVFNTMKILLIISGVSLPIAILTILVYVNTHNSNILRIISMYSILMVIGAFILALLIGSVGACMESHSERKDKKAKRIQQSRTWVLLNGYIVVADQHQGRGGQMVKPYVMDEYNIVDVPFSHMDIIDNVHSVYSKSGKLIADVDAMEYYIKHPYVNENPETDNISHYFHYYQKRVRRKIEWYENMLGIDKLIKALNMLKH